MASINCISQQRHTRTELGTMSLHRHRCCNCRYDFRCCVRGLRVVFVVYEYLRMFTNVYECLSSPNADTTIVVEFLSPSTNANLRIVILSAISIVYLASF
jgi:hypothetical protein